MHPQSVDYSLSQPGANSARHRERALPGVLLFVHQWKMQTRGEAEEGTFHGKVQSALEKPKRNSPRIVLHCLLSQPSSCL